MSRSEDYPLVIVGAGAAGLGASAEAKARGIDHEMLEASHRIGGRGLTEQLAGEIPVDLGCHWLHCASKNPFVEMADSLGFAYRRGNPPILPRVDGEWRSAGEFERLAAAWDAMEQRAGDCQRAGEGLSLLACAGEENPDLAWLNYWSGLMYSADLDQVAAADMSEYRDTGEDWPVARGYGALITAVGADSPVTLNCPVERLRWGGNPLVLETPKGDIRAGKVLVTVSTGILNADAITFTPELPAWKREAAEALPLGDMNYVFFHLPRGQIEDAPESIAYQQDDTTALVRIRPEGQDCAVAALGGRFAWWMERQGEPAAKQWFRDILADLFGHDALRGLGQFRASAWGYDPWIRGAYSARRPGSGDARAELARPIDGKLWFAGEAASRDQFCTAHGAWLSGRDAVTALAG